HEDTDDLLLRIDEEVRVVRAAPAEAALRQPRVPRGRVADDAQPEPETFARIAARQRVGCKYGRHQLDRPWAQESCALELTVVREHRRETQVVFGRAREAAAAGEIDAVHPRLVRDLLQRAVHAAVERRLARLDAVAIEKSVLHSERLEDSLLDEFVE